MSPSEYVCRACFDHADEHTQHVMEMNSPIVNVSSSFDAYQSYEAWQPTEVVNRWESHRCSGFINPNGDTDPRPYFSWKVDDHPLVEELMQPDPDQGLRDQTGLFDEQ